MLAVRNPSWTYEATQAIKSWPRGADDARAVSGLIDALRIFGSAMPGSAAALDCVVATLHLLSRTAQDDAATIAALRVALTSAERSTDQPWVVQRVMAHLLLFGDLSVADAGGLDPWNAMWAHWKSNRWSWADVAKSLVEAGAIDPADESRLNEAEQSSADITDFFTTLLSPEGARVVFSWIRDDGYELHHHKLFGDLVAAVRPPLEVQALSQSWDHQLAEVPPSETKSMRYLRIVDGETQWAPLDESTLLVYSTEGTTCVVHFVHANEVYGFLTQPNGTWMDVWGVVDAFDSFMRAHGRPERAYCLADPPGWNGEYLLFLTAPRPVRRDCRPLALAAEAAGRIGRASAVAPCSPRYDATARRTSLQRRRYRSRTLDDQPVRLRLPMLGEIEGRVLVRQREVEIAASDREFIAFRRAGGHDFT